MTVPDQDATKLCLFCRNFQFDGGGQYWSTLTPGWPASIACEERHFDVALYELGATEEFRALILKARTCPDFDCVGETTGDEQRDHQSR